MARNDTITEQQRTFGGKNFRGKLVGDPLTSLQEKVQSNIREVTKRFKEKMVDIIKGNVEEGAEGTSYSKQYAMKKSLSSQVEGTARPGGQYDYQWSGQLLNSLVGRGRAKPSQGVFNIWVGFKRQQRRPIKKTDGSNPSRRSTPTNRRLAQILTRGEGNVDKPTKSPFALHRDDHQRLIGQVASDLMESSN